MWYVNEIVKHEDLRAILGFILTMWYVNKVMLQPIITQIMSFILTMWYVNCNVMLIQI